MYCLCYLFIIHFPFFSEITLLAPAATQTHFHSYIITTFFWCILTALHSHLLSHTIYYIVLFTTLLCCFNEQGRFVLVLCCCCVVFLFYTSHKIVHLFKLFFYFSNNLCVLHTDKTDRHIHTLTDTNNLTFTLPLSNLQCKTQ